MGLFSSGVVPPLLVLLGLLYGGAASSSAPLPPPPPEILHGSYAGKSEFRTVNRKELQSCLNPSPYLAINVSTGGAPLPDEAFVKVTVAGVLRPDASDWVAMITPSNSRCLHHYHCFNPIVFCRSHAPRAKFADAYTRSVSGCPLSGVNYVETGDLANLPLLCHYPVKVSFFSSFQFLYALVVP